MVVNETAAHRAAGLDRLLRMPAASVRSPGCRHRQLPTMCTIARDGSLCDPHDICTRASMVGRAPPPTPVVALYAR